MQLKAIPAGAFLVVAVGCGMAPTADEQISVYLTDVATAQLIERRCDGLTLRADTEALGQSFKSAMLDAGYSREEFNDALARADASKTARAVVARIVAQGVDILDAESVGAHGRDQMAAGSQVGRFLKSGR